MARGNTELVRVAYDAFNRRDLESLLAIMHPEFELDFSRSVGPEPGVYSGEEGMRRLFATYWDAFEEISLEPEELIDGGEVVIAVVRARGRGRGSGIEVDARGPHMWSLREGKVAGFALFQDLDEALEAAGLSASGP